MPPHPGSAPDSVRPLLDIIVIWHPDDIIGHKVFSRLLNHYHSPAFAGLAGGSVEVYSRSAPGTLDAMRRETAPIPVPQPTDTAPSPAEFTAIIPVIDTELIRASMQPGSPWHDYLVESLHPIEDAPSQRIIIPVTINEPGHPSAPVPGGPVRQLLDNTQAIAIEPAQLDANASTVGTERRNWIDKTALERNVGQAIIQQISDEWTTTEPLKVFISHTKRTHTAEPSVVEAVREFINTTTLRGFFDEDSIQTSTPWKKAIHENAARCALLMVRTDNYATRHWTQEEVLLAKTNDVPIVALTALTNGEERGCFIMDHVPTVAYDPARERESVARALCRLVDETLKRVLWNKQQSFTTTSGIDWHPVHAPEPITVTAWLKRHPKSDRHLWIVHPDPPLAKIEKDLIRDMCDLAGFDAPGASLEIVTPREFRSRGGVMVEGADPKIEVPEGALNGKRLGISVSECEDLQNLGLDAAHLDYAIAELAQLTFVHGGSIVYGGRIGYDKHDITSFLAEQANRYGTDSDASTCITFENYMPWSEFMRASDDNLDHFNRQSGPHGRLFIVHGESVLKLSEARSLRPGAEGEVCPRHALTDMRARIADVCDARVLIGGRLQRSDYATVPGTLEEAFETLKRGKPVYVCGGLGGTATHLAHVLELPTPSGYHSAIPEINAATSSLLSDIKERWPNVDNGLTSDETNELAASHHPSTIAGLVLRGMTRLTHLQS